MRLKERIGSVKLLLPSVFGFVVLGLVLLVVLGVLAEREMFHVLGAHP
jgi:hypothetical protein